MSAPRRRSGPPDLAPYLAFAAVGLLTFASLVVWIACAAAQAIGHKARPPANFAGYFVEIITGQRAWPGPIATQVLVVEILAVVAVAVLSRNAVFGLRKGRTRVDVAARHLAKKKDLVHLSTKGASATAARLGAKTSAPGVLVGEVIGTGKPLWGPWEDLHVDIWGTRAGKTTSRAIPAIIPAPGAVLVTSNKRDIVDATRLPREKAGPVWVFDPQDVANEDPDWWWNPLSYVVDVDHAARLATVFSAYSRDPQAKSDAYFDTEGELLLAFLLLAAAEGGLPITQVYRWLSDPTDDQAVGILRAAGHELPAEHVQGVVNYPDKQRGGVFATARKSVGCLINPAVTRWVTPGAGREFSPEKFVRSSGTLYSLSREGQGTAGPLVTALTIAVIEAAEAKATASPGGRLAVPLVGVLDEAANVCRWKSLPDLYSHYGSRGIVLLTILQSWAQGVEVWGEHGMAKLWSSANIRVYGGGAADPRFLSDLTQLIGDYEPISYSTTVQTGRGHHSHSVSSSTRPEKILDVADLFSLPRGRAIVLPSGAPPVLIKTLPWQSSPYAPTVRESLAKYAPEGNE
ncbi:type IV secretory system conjugative DNA transfer family protein [Actinomadura rayongensis]|uniref:TraM recognition domain-containing protein n=1 Tax=Actinomadura rayongensis TaxID=1429076 RepID=A0A6I4WBJ6_9ACTN|nr:TraM recognition domain-containing protein [Actinomadura rayongensis]MXQ65635.1 TraM recognition domain-containing protein [Actinomadura rayongensis]